MRNVHGAETFPFLSVSENHGQKASPKKEETNVSNGNIEAQTFTFRELAAATNNFMPECLIGEGGFGRVYRGELEGTGQVTSPLRKCSL